MSYKRRSKEEFNRHNPAYFCWMAMNARCNNPNSLVYFNYGGRGIKICERWKSFKLFILDMGPRPKNYDLDRIDADGNYEPSNCRWASRKENCLNRRCCKKYEKRYIRVDINKLCECCLHKVKGNYEQNHTS